MGRPSRRRRRSLWLALGLGGVLGVLVVAGVVGWRGEAQPELVRVESLTHAFPHNHLHGLGFDARDDRLVLATHYGLFVLSDHGLFQLGPSHDDFMGFSIHPHDPRVIYTSGHPRMGGNLGVMRSDDGGRTWRQLFRGVAGETVDFHSMTISAADPARLYGVFQGRLYVTADGGTTWRIAAARGLPAADGPCWGVPCLAADSAVPDTLYAGTAQGLFRSLDGGETWRRIAPELDAVAGVGVDPRDPGRLLVYSRPRGTLRSEDAGQTWRPATAGLALGHRDYVFGFAFDPGPVERAFAATVGGAVYRSRDGGVTWERAL
jgi:hypothetical protein